MVWLNDFGKYTVANKTKGNQIRINHLYLGNDLLVNANNCYIIVHGKFSIKS